MAMCMYGTQRHTSKSCRTRRATPSGQSISRQTRLGLSLGPLTRRPPSGNSQTSPNTRPRALGARNDILGAGRSTRDRHRSIRSSLGQRRPLARDHQSRSHPVVQYWPPLVRHPPLCLIQRSNQAIRSIIHRVGGLGMASSRHQFLFMHCPTEAQGIHRILYKAHRHILGHDDTHPVWSHRTHSSHTFNRNITRRPVSRNWWAGRAYYHPKSRPDHCKFRVLLKRGQISYWLLVIYSRPRT